MDMYIPEVSARECYNYKEEPEVRHCSTGCCGDKYKEYCCNATMQIVGSVLGRFKQCRNTKNLKHSATDPTWAVVCQI